MGITFNPLSGQFDDTGSDGNQIDHTIFVLVDGTRPLTGDWDNIGRRIRNTGVAEVTGTEPSTPATGLLWLDTAATGSSAAGVFVITEITTNLSLTADHTVIFADATAGDITVTLPAISGNAGRYYRVKKIDSSINTVVVDGSGAETIDGDTITSITTQYDALDFIASNSEWGIF